MITPLIINKVRIIDRIIAWLTSPVNWRFGLYYIVIICPLWKFVFTLQINPIAGWMPDDGFMELDDCKAE